MVPIKCERVKVQTGITSCAVLMSKDGWVYRRRQRMTDYILSKQCNVMDMVERWFR